MLRAQMQEAVDHCRVELDRAIFTSTAPAGPPPVPPSRLQFAFWRVKGYLWTLWRALRGDDLDTPSDEY